MLHRITKRNQKQNTNFRHNLSNKSFFSFVCECGTAIKFGKIVFICALIECYYISIILSRKSTFRSITIKCMYCCIHFIQNPTQFKNISIGVFSPLFSCHFSSVHIYKAEYTLRVKKKREETFKMIFGRRFCLVSLYSMHIHYSVYICVLFTTHHTVIMVLRKKYNKHINVRV